MVKYINNAAVETEEYKKFVEKFKIKKTTDDCYTPPKVYEAVKDWACEYYGIAQDKIVRPFYPGGDYENYDYSNDAVVVDNPPFSILAKIIDFYTKRGIPFFLFAPAMTLFNYMKDINVNAVVTDSQIVYENGAKVKTAFITSLGEYAVEINLELMDAIDKAVRELRAEQHARLPKYVYPDNVLMVSDLQKMANKKIDMKIKRKDLQFIRSLDSQRKYKKELFGGGFLMSEKVAKEKAEKAEKAVDKYIWILSNREKEIIGKLG